MSLFGLFGPLGLRRLYRRLRVTLLGPAKVTGSCLMCGNCCRELVLFADGGWITSRKAFRKFVRENAEYDRLYVTGADQRGLLIFACSWLTEDGLCKDHLNRLELCRDHPSASFYTCGAELSPHCGYAVKPPPWSNLLPWRRKARDFEAVLQKARERESLPETDQT